MPLLAVALVLGGLAAGQTVACVDDARTVVASEEAALVSSRDLFAAPDALSVKIAVPLATLFRRLLSGEQDPPESGGADAGVQIPFEKPEYSELGTLTLTVNNEMKAFDVRVYTRGESSLRDCPFPKLKIKFTNKEQLRDTPFAGHSKFRLNTHCGPGDASARSEMGRVFNGVGPVREELAYRLVRAMGIPTYLSRVLAVHYDDTASAEQTHTFAVAIESGDDAAQRFRSTVPPLIAKDDEYLAPSVARGLPISAVNAAQIAIAEAFVGNNDWGGTHNIDSFGKPNAAQIMQIAQDFDLGAIVLGDIATYWKGVAPVSKAKPVMNDRGLVESLRSRKRDVQMAYAEAEKVAIAARAVPSNDGATTTDPGFLEAKRRIEELFTLLEQNDPAAGADDAGSAWFDRWH